jgi:hypothetical protein
MKKFRLNQIPLRDKVWRSKGLYPLAAKVILLDLLWYAGSNNSAFPSQKTLARNHYISTRYVRKMLKLLKQYGCIYVRRIGFSKGNSYTFNRELYDIISHDNKEQTS